MPTLLAMLRSPYALIAQGFLFGGLIVLATGDSREAAAAPAPAAISPAAR
jgi:hypothetical protein